MSLVSQLRQLLGPRLAVATLMLYGWAVWVVPYVHQAHHRSHGEDHVHTPEGTVYRARGLEVAPHRHGQIVHRHAAPVAAAAAASDAHDAPAPPRAPHARGAVEHLWLLTVGQPTFVFAVPVLPVVELSPAPGPELLAFAPAPRPSCRGPPATLAG
jgi:hypothetical protein